MCGLTLVFYSFVLIDIFSECEKLYRAIKTVYNFCLSTITKSIVCEGPHAVLYNKCMVVSLLRYPAQNSITIELIFNIET